VNVDKKNKGGRPRKEIDFKLFEDLCAIHCTETEISGILKVSIETLNARIKEEYGDGFQECFKRFSAKGKASLRRLQFKLAERNAAMAIWLGKQYLGQREPESNYVRNPVVLPGNLDDLSETEINDLYRKLKDEQGR
jgi:hypothetical protein